ncbi:hypothetical protein [Methylomonas albis]|nr:hypothetical protein [Methylomonas albis]
MAETPVFSNHLAGDIKLNVKQTFKFTGVVIPDRAGTTIFEGRVNNC